MGKVIPAREVLADRVRSKFWSLSARARNLKRLEKGDKVLFYITGSREKGFMGRGVLAGPSHLMTEEQRFHVIGEPSTGFDHAVDFEEAEIWDRVITLDEVKDEMPLLRRMGNPSRAFRGAIRRITEEDYGVVVRAYEGSRKGLE